MPISISVLSERDLMFPGNDERTDEISQAASETDPDLEERSMLSHSRCPTLAQYSPSIQAYSVHCSVTAGFQMRYSTNDGKCISFAMLLHLSNCTCYST
eukprot:6473567-Amphidinium_carterae.1